MSGAKIYSQEMRNLQCSDGDIITYELLRKAVKNVNLRIDAAGKIKISANKLVPVSFIEQFIQENQLFIRTAQEQIRQRNLQKEKEQEKAPRQYADGETIRILGKILEIKVTQDSVEGIYFDDAYFYLHTKEPENVHHKELLYEKWLKSFQKEVFEKVCGEVHQIFKAYDVQYPEIKMRHMTSRWGSCQPNKGIVTLNSRLIEVPLPCIEYVAMHEFTHFIYPNHSKDFHALMTKLMPDWKQRKNVLDSVTQWN